MQPTEGDFPAPESTLPQFLHLLITEGRAIVSPIPLDPSAEPAETVFPLLQQLESRYRLDLPGEPPPFSKPVALWAAQLFYHICQFIVCREIGEPEVRAVFALPCPALRGAAADWSADLLFRHLPTLFRSAKHLSNADPLLDELKTLAAAWPLSSVGIPALPDLNIDSFISDETLARLYVDRIIATNDLSRLGHPRVDELLRAALGLHRALAPDLALRLFPEEQPS